MTVSSNDLPGGVQYKPGPLGGGDGQGPERLRHPLPSGRISECFTPSSHVWVALGDGGAEAGDFTYGTIKNLS